MGLAPINKKISLQVFLFTETDKIKKNSLTTSLNFYFFNLKQS